MVSVALMHWILYNLLERLYVRAPMSKWEALEFLLYPISRQMSAGIGPSPTFDPLSISNIDNGWMIEANIKVNAQQITVSNS